jgi:hypothetical protein
LPAQIPQEILGPARCRENEPALLPCLEASFRPDQHVHPPGPVQRHDQGVEQSRPEKPYQGVGRKIAVQKDGKIWSAQPVQAFQPVDKVVGPLFTGKSVLMQKDQTGDCCGITSGSGLQPLQGKVGPGKVTAIPLRKGPFRQPICGSYENRPMGNGRRETEKVVIHYKILTSERMCAIHRRKNCKVIYQYMQTKKAVSSAEEEDSII